MVLKYKLGNDTSELLAVIGFLTEALQFYGMAVNTRSDGTPCMLDNALALDRGTRAREALELVNDYLMSCGIDTKVLLRLPYTPYLSELDLKIFSEIHDKNLAIHFFTNISGGHSLVGTMFSDRIVRTFSGVHEPTYGDLFDGESGMTQQELLQQFQGKRLIYHVGVAQGMPDLTEDVNWIMRHMKPASIQLNVTSA